MPTIGRDYWEGQRTKASIKLKEVRATKLKLEELLHSYNVIYLRYHKMHREADRELAKIDGRSRTVKPYLGKTPPKQVSAKDLPKSELDDLIKQLEQLQEGM